MTPAELRAYAKLPEEVPEEFLDTHLSAARRDLQRDTGLADAPAGQAADWQEAVLCRAYALAVPFLHLFVVDGAARAGRLAGSVDFQFLTPEETVALARSKDERYGYLVAALRPVPEQSAAPDVARAGCFTFMAI